MGNIRKYSGKKLSKGDSSSYAHTTSKTVSKDVKKVVFTKASSEELKELRVDVYSYLMQNLDHINLLHYKYHFVQNKYEDAGDGLKYKKLYSFKSPKSNQCYWVWVEVYDRNMYAVKFHLKADRHNKNKYHRLTQLKEARPVINTCIRIMIDIHHSNIKASFGFIGSNLENELESNTKRYKVYKRIMATYFSESLFTHYFNNDKSAYLLLRNSEIERNPLLLIEIQDFFTENYNYFD